MPHAGKARIAEAADDSGVTGGDREAPGDRQGQPAGFSRGLGTRRRARPLPNPLPNLRTLGRGVGDPVVLPLPVTIEMLMPALAAASFTMAWDCLIGGIELPTSSGGSADVVEYSVSKQLLS